jgi:AraC family transcriptional regulator
LLYIISGSKSSSIIGLVCNTLAEKEFAIFTLHVFAVTELTDVSLLSNNVSNMIHLSHGQYLGSNKRCYDAGGIILTETEYHSKVFEGWHAHENIHISLIIKGGNREERKQKDTVVLPGTLLFYHPDELHRNLHTSHPSKNINLEISAELMRQYELGEQELANMARHPDASFNLLKMYREAALADHFSATSIQMLLLELISETKELRQKQSAWLKTVIDFLHDNWQQHPSLTELAAISGVNPFTVSKHFSKYMGCTLGEYMRKLKVQQALRLIHSGNIPLTEVAYFCGFADQSHFTRNFRGLTHFLPKTYQKL